MKGARVFAAAAVFLFMAGCGGSQQVVKKEAESPCLNNRPEWTCVTPEDEGDYIYFVGISKPNATEQGSEQTAMDHASGKVVQYIQNLVRVERQSKELSMGLASAGIDPTVIENNYQKQLAANVTSRLKRIRSHVEAENAPTGRMYTTWVLTRINKTSIEEAHQRTADKNLEAARRDAREASDEKARQQAERAVEFWEKLKDKKLVD